MIRPRVLNLKTLRHPKRKERKHTFITVTCFPLASGELLGWLFKQKRTCRLLLLRLRHVCRQSITHWCQKRQAITTAPPGVSKRHAITFFFAASYSRGRLSVAAELCCRLQDEEWNVPAQHCGVIRRSAQLLVFHQNDCVDSNGKTAYLKNYIILKYELFHVEFFLSRLHGQMIISAHRIGY